MKDLLEKYNLDDLIEVVEDRLADYEENASQYEGNGYPVGFGEKLGQVVDLLYELKQFKNDPKSMEWYERMAVLLCPYCQGKFSRRINIDGRHRPYELECPNCGTAESVGTKHPQHFEVIDWGN